LEPRKKYDRWLDTEDPVVVANAMFIIIGRVLNMLKGQKNAEPPPRCPQCQKPMRRRQSAKGDFWGCSVYLACKGILSV
jgi:hypothetical protein